MELRIGQRIRFRKNFGGPIKYGIYLCDALTDGFVFHYCVLDDNGEHHKVEIDLVMSRELDDGNPNVMFRGG